MGRVVVPMLVENVVDLYNAESGLIPPEQVRRVEVAEALVDTGATQLSLPPSLIAQLGLHPMGVRRAMTGGGVVQLRTFSPVRITVQGRFCNGDVTELPEGASPTLGWISLHALDFVVDLASRRLVGNPAHGGEQMIEAY
jgi:predicted aspartyl protease